MFKQQYKLEELPKIAQLLIGNLKYSVVAFHAEMGSGKTTLIKEIIKQLGVKDEVSSPTFSIVNSYQNEEGKDIFHFDMYRIEDEEEAYDFGIEEYLDSENLCLIEWPECIESILDFPHHKVSIAINEDFSRTIKFE